ncbi:MAG: PorT family protein [Bacteroidales bacterium]|nr:PorT family protein [Bacteroidales bacterium]
MKKITLIIAAIAALFSTNANAQLKNDTEGYQRYEVSFVAQKFDWGHDDNTKLKGFELGYINGINVTNKLPIFLELGGQLTWTHANDEIATGEELKHTFMSIAIPVNAAYKIAFASSENITIVPFIGPNFKFNLIGKEKGSILGNEYDLSFLNKDDMGGKDNKASRFQVGMNLGVGVNISKLLYIGYHFQPDFADYLDGVKAKTNYITVGVNF